MTREEMLDEAVRRALPPGDRAWFLKRMGEGGASMLMLWAVRAEFRRQYEMNVCEACGSTDKYPEHLCPAKPRKWMPSYRESN